MYGTALTLVLGLLAALANAQPPASVGATFTATVVHVADGDTVDVRVRATGERVRIRVHGIDAPERGEAFGQVALRFTRATVFGRVVSVEGRDVDAYGRLVARVRVDGTDLGETLVRAGLACHYRRYSDDPVFERAEDEARAAGRGFWARGASRPRCVAGARHDTSSEDPPRTREPRPPSTYEGRVVGNVSSRVYHAPTCRSASCRRCTRHFATRAEAEAAAFRPAGDCLSRR